MAYATKTKGQISDARYTLDGSRVQDIVDSILTSVPTHQTVQSERVGPSGAILLNLDSGVVGSDDPLDGGAFFRLFHPTHRPARRLHVDMSALEEVLLSMARTLYLLSSALGTKVLELFHDFHARAERYVADLRANRPSLSLPRREISERFIRARQHTVQLSSRRTVHSVPIVHLVTPSRVRVTCFDRRPSHAVTPRIVESTTYDNDIQRQQKEHLINVTQKSPGTNMRQRAWVEAVRLVAAQLSGKRLTKM